MVRGIQGEATGRQREMLEAVGVLGPVWRQALDSGAVLVQFRQDQDVPEGDLQFAANVFGFEQVPSSLAGRWDRYKFK